MSKRNLEEIVIEWMNSIVPDYPCSSEKPKNLPEKFSLVERQGGPRIAMLGDSANVLIEIYDKTSKPDCAEIADFIADSAKTLEEEYADVTSVTVNSVISNEDTERQYYRYEIFLDIFYSRVSDNS